MTADRGRDGGVTATARKSAEVLKKARERTEVELTKRCVDLTTGGSRGTMVAAFAVAATLPLADAAHLYDQLTDMTDLANMPLAEDLIQSRPCRRRYCG